MAEPIVVEEEATPPPPPSPPVSDAVRLAETLARSPMPRIAPWDNDSFYQVEPAPVVVVGADKTLYELWPWGGAPWVICLHRRPPLYRRVPLNEHGWHMAVAPTRSSTVLTRNDQRKFAAITTTAESILTSIFMGLPVWKLQCSTGNLHPDNGRYAVIERGAK